MAGGALHHLSLDLLNQQWRTLWPTKGHAPEATGIPLHEATLDRESQRLYLATRALDRDEVSYSAVNADSGQKLWTRQLGISPILRSARCRRAGHARRSDGPAAGADHVAR